MNHIIEHNAAVQTNDQLSKINQILKGSIKKLVFTVCCLIVVLTVLCGELAWLIAKH